MENSGISQAIKTLSSNDYTQKFEHFRLQGNKFYFGEEDQYQIKVANTQDLKDQAYRLIYEIYLEKGFIEPNEEKAWYTQQTLKENTVTLVVLDRSNTVVGTSTLVFDNHGDLPAYSIFSEELNTFHRIGEHRFAEITSLGVQKNVRGTEDILVKLFCFSYLISYKIFNMTDFVITVNPKHVMFYMKKMIFESYV